MRNITFACLAAVSAALSCAQIPAAAGAPAQIIITVGHNYGEESGPLTTADLTITREVDKLPIIALTPLRGDRGKLELFVVVDNCASCEVGSKFDELKRFLRARPASTEIGVAYIQDGKLQIALPPARDHERAVKALNEPEGSKPANPFVALTELIKSWPADSARHVVLLISNGIDPGAIEGRPNDAAEAAIDTAQRAGVILYTIYHPAADYSYSEFAKIYAGQIQLAHVSNETGGEAYLLGAGPLPSLSPFLADIADHLANQYELEFMANPEDGPGGLQDISVRSKNRAFDIMAPARVWVPGRGTIDLRTRSLLDK